MTAKWAGVPAWELYGGERDEWVGWYDIVSRSVTGAEADLAKPVERTRY